MASQILVDAGTGPSIHLHADRSKANGDLHVDNAQALTNLPEGGHDVRELLVPGAASCGGRTSCSVSDTVVVSREPVDGHT